MSVEEIKALARHLFEEYNKGKEVAMAAIDETYATDFVWHRGTGEVFHSLKNYKQSQSELYSAFPDVHFTIDDIVVQGDKAAVRWTFTGTHKGERWGIPPTDKKVTVWGIWIDRIAGGKFAESWTRYDTLAFMQQLGVVPTPGKEK